jgi:hypothetical protein
VTSWRAKNFSQVGEWLGIFGVSLGLMIAPDWGTRIWAMIIWSVLVGQRGTEQLRSDLELWAISRTLPFSATKMLVAEIAQPTIAVVLLGWLAFGLSRWMGFIPHWIITWLTPWITIGIVLAATADILHLCRSGDLLVGQVPAPGIGGLVLGLLITGLPLIIILGITHLIRITGIIWLITIFGTAVIMGTVIGMWKLAATQYKNIK